MGYRKQMSNPINESGKFGEKRFKEFLKEYSIPYKRPGREGIDFRVYTNGLDNEPIYIDIKNQKDGGGRDGDVAHCVWKYQKMYGFKECYIVEGEFDFRPKVREHANVYAKTHFVKFEEMKKIMLDKKIVEPMEKFQ
jgi:hypothetical protein